MGKNLLIVGIDPGTTVGFAVLDLEGNLVIADSIRNFGVDELISQVMQLGTVVAVGTDKRLAPVFVSRFANALKARLISPEEDMRVYEKNLMVRDSGVKDSHQADALAAALFAYKRLRSLITKLDNFVERKQKQGIADKLKELVIKNSINMRLALTVVEEPEREESRVVKRAVERAPSIAGFLRLYERLLESEKALALLKEQNLKLRRMLDEERKRFMAAQKGASKEKLDEKARSLIRFKERSIQLLAREKRDREEAIKGLGSEISLLRGFLADANSCYVLKKLRNLGKEEFGRKERLLNIAKGDILLVDDVQIVNDDVVELLSKRIKVLVYNGRPNSLLERKFLTINAKSLEIKEAGDFAIVKKEALDMEIGKKDIIEKVLGEYRH